MSSTMFSAREVLIPGSAYDRSGAAAPANMNGGKSSHTAPGIRTRSRSLSLSKDYIYICQSQ